jgi:D-sedoheptulose 7-phosphate isomerase
MDEAGVRRIASESIALQERFFTENARQLVEVGRRLTECLRSGGKLLAFGNGGSAADAQHLVGELVVRFMHDRPGLPAIALTTDSSVITAAANDVGFESVFRRQVEALGQPGDAAVGISTSGRSPNVVEALRLARLRGLLTIGLSGGGGGRLGGLCHYLIDVPHHETARIQEVHAIVIHLLCQIVEEAMRP